MSSAWGGRRSGAGSDRLDLVAKGGEQRFDDLVLGLVMIIEVAGADVHGQSAMDAVVTPGSPIR